MSGPMELPLVCCVVAILLTKSQGLKTNSTREMLPSNEMSTTEPTISTSHKLIDWFLKGSTWRIFAAAVGGFLLVTLLILALYRIRKRRLSKRQTVEEKTIDISVPQDSTFMGSRSADVVPTVEIQECPEAKPHLKSKLLRSFTNEGKSRYSFGRSQRRSDAGTRHGVGEDCTHQETPPSTNVTEPSSFERSNATCAKSKNRSSFFSKWRKHEPQNHEDEVIYENQDNLLKQRELQSSSTTETCKAQPIYENSKQLLSEQGMEWHDQGGFVNDQVIYQNSTVSAGPGLDCVNAPVSEPVDFHRRTVRYQGTTETCEQANFGQIDEGVNYENSPQNGYDSRQRSNDRFMADGRAPMQCLTRRESAVQDQRRHNAVLRSKSNVEGARISTLPLLPPEHRNASQSNVNNQWQFAKCESLGRGLELGHQTNTQSLMNVLGTRKKSVEWQSRGQVEQHQDYPLPTDDYDDINVYRK